MATALNQQADVWSSERGEFVSSKHETLARQLQLYSSTYSLVYSPKGVDLAGKTARFAILESAPGREPYIVRYLLDEMLDNPQAIIDWIAAGDTRRHKAQDILAQIEAEDFRLDRVKKAARKEQNAPGNDLAASVVAGGRDHKFFYKANGKTWRR